VDGADRRLVDREVAAFVGADQDLRDLLLEIVTPPFERPSEDDQAGQSLRAFGHHEDSRDPCLCWSRYILVAPHSVAFAGANNPP